MPAEAMRNGGYYVFHSCLSFGPDVLCQHGHVHTASKSVTHMQPQRHHMTAVINCVACLANIPMFSRLC